MSIDLSIYFCTCLFVWSSVRPPTKWQVEDVKPKRSARVPTKQEVEAVKMQQVNETPGKNTS
jgi:hypothetical protein